MMVEVFKTNVVNKEQATMLLDEIHKKFAGYQANFDLEDCDHILRVASGTGVHVSALTDLVTRFGFHAEVLPDDIPEVLTF